MAEFDGESEMASETDLFGNSVILLTKRGRGILFRIIGELEQIGYSVQAFVIPACAVNAPHRRDRVWIVAHRTREQDNGKRGTYELGRNGLGRKEEASQQDNRATCNDSPRGQDSDATHSKRTERTSERRKTRGWRPEHRCDAWRENWLTVATEFCSLDDGLPHRMGGLKLSKSKHREEQLKGYGNAIVPEVAEQIMHVIKSIEEQQPKGEQQ